MIGKRLTEWWRDLARGDRAEVWPRAAGIGFLVLLSVLYGIASSLALWLRSLAPRRVRVPVISVGNVVAGGTGKTPLVIYLARLLAKDRDDVAIVSRGYGRNGRGTVVVSRGERPLVGWEEAGDEPYLMAVLTKGVGIVVATRRAAGVRYAVKRMRAGVILLDDAFQHVQLARDLDIVTLDARRPLGNGHLLPGGILREHPHGLRRAHLLVATRCDAEGDPASEVRRVAAAFAPGADVVETRMKPVELWSISTGEKVSLSSARREPVLVLSSIGDPADFERTVERLGFEIAGVRSFPDHYRYGPEDLRSIESLARSCGAGAIVTTEKDSVRLTAWRPAVPLLAIGIELEFVRGEEIMRESVETVLGE